MDEEFESLGISHFAAALAVVVFGWGSIWVGAQGMKIAFGWTPEASYSTAAAIDATPTTSATPSKPSKPVALPAISLNLPSSSISVMMGGDVMFDRGMRALGEKNGYDRLLEGVSSLFAKADIVTANLEGPITTNSSRTLLVDGSFTKSFAFTFAPKSAETLNIAGITAVSLANNHSMNFGTAGIAETKKWLSDSHVEWFGTPGNSTSAEAVLTKNDIPVAFIGYNSFEPGFEKIVESVKALSQQGDFVIVMPHWGTEYATSSSELMRSQARILVAAGAGAIIGSHPHVVMDHSWIGGVPVFYSLGNLLFDQYFSPEVMRGNIVDLHITKDISGIHVTSVDVYNTSMASRTGVTVDAVPTYSEHP